MESRSDPLPEVLFGSLAGTALNWEAAVAAGPGRRREPAPKAHRPAGERWYRSPVIWIAVAMLVASIAGCIVTILLALGQPEDALPDIGERLLSVPAAALLGVPAAALLGVPAAALLGVPAAALLGVPAAAQVMR